MSDPTAENLVDRYPEFSPVSTTRITSFIAEAVRGVGDWGDDRPAAIKALAAHMLTMEGEPGRSDGTGTDFDARRGAVLRERHGDVEVAYGANGRTALSSNRTADYSETPYGRYYLLLLARHVSGPRIV